MVTTPVQLGQALQQAVGDKVDVVNQPVDDVPVGIAVNIFQRHLVKLSKGLLP